MGNLQVFNFNGADTRVQIVNGEPWFVAKDVADVLGYSDTQAMTRRLDGDELATCTDDSSGQVRHVVIINESGLYSAILGSTKPEARNFKKWVTGEVLPAIRKQGGYMVARNDETPEQLYARCMTVLHDTIERQKKQIAAQDAQLRLQAPAVKYCETVLASTSLMTCNTIAAHLGVSAKRLNAFLSGEGWIYQQGRNWCPSAKIRNLGFGDYETVPYLNRAGDQCTAYHWKWTEPGRKAIIKLWNRRHNVVEVG